MAREVPPHLLKKREWVERRINRVLARRESPTEVRDFLQTIGPTREPSLPAPWRRPDKRMQRISRDQIADAVEAVRLGADRLRRINGAVRLRRITGVYAGSVHHRQGLLEFKGSDGAPDFAPLIAHCLDDETYEGLRELVISAHSKVLRESTEVLAKAGIYVHDAYPGEDGLALMERANQSLLTEAILWDFAGEGGYQGGLPYPVRYFSAAYLWTPKIDGVAWCLRCGDLLIPKRKGRTSGPTRRRVPVCVHCLRSGIAWPPNAVMPERRGRWWLMCQHPGCTSAFVGAGQARHCPEHRQERLSRVRRRKEAPVGRSNTPQPP
jgi:hypothetical protein